jgi:hypothetical protein
MIQSSSGRNTALAGVIGLLLAGVPSVAAPGSAQAASRGGHEQNSCWVSDGSIHLVTLDNALDGSFQCLGLAVEHGTVMALRLETHHISASGRPGDVSTEEFPVAVVESSHGAVLDGVPGHDAIILRGHFPKSPERVELMTSFLYNGFTNEYRSCPVTLDREPNGGWRLLNRFNQIVSHIAVRTREMPVIGAFGIADLEGVCTPGQG